MDEAMKLLLVRDVYAPRFTLGKLHVNNIRQFYTIEDKVREVKGEPVECWKVPGETAIPAGTYPVVITKSKRFNKPMPLLLDVPGFLGIRIHAGNRHPDTEGCILVGTMRTSDGVANSRYACGILLESIQRALDNGQKVTIEIR